MGNMLAFLGRDMAVDLGTANTLVYVRGRGIALNEPSVVALNTDTGKIVAVGVQAERMIERMLRYFIQKVHRRRHLAKPRLVVAVPSGITAAAGLRAAGRHAGSGAQARRLIGCGGQQL